MKNYPKISVLIPVFNEEQMLSGALDSLLECKYKNIEVIIAVDTKQDTTLDIAKKYAKKYKKISVDFSPIRRGTTGAMNFMIKKAKGEIILKFDADHRIGNPTNFFQNLVKHFENEKLGGICIFGYGKVENKKLIREIERQVNTSWIARGERVICDVVDMFKKSRLPISEIPNYPIDVNCFRKSVVSKLDPRVIHDDALLAYKILEKGYKIDIASDVIVIDFGHPTSLKRFFNQKIKGVVGWQDLSKKYKLDMKSYYFNLIIIFFKNIKKFNIRDILAFFYWMILFALSSFASLFKRKRKPTDVWKKRK